MFRRRRRDPESVWRADQWHRNRSCPGRAREAARERMDCFALRSRALSQALRRAEWHPFARAGLWATAARDLARGCGSQRKIKEARLRPHETQHWALGSSVLL